MASGDALEVLDTVEDAFREVALPTEPSLRDDALLAVGPRWDVGLSVLGCGSVTDGVAVGPVVADQGCSLRNGLQQSFGFLTVVDLAAGQSHRATGRPSASTRA